MYIKYIYIYIYKFTGFRYINTFIVHSSRYGHHDHVAVARAASRQKIKGADGLRHIVHIRILQQ